MILSTLCKYLRNIIHKYAILYRQQVNHVMKYLDLFILHRCKNLRKDQTAKLVMSVTVKVRCYGNNLLFIIALNPACYIAYLPFLQVN